MKNKEVTRIKQVIESDRLGMSGDCKEILKRDIADTLANYFELKSLPDIKIEAGVKGFSVYISAEGDAFKSFHIIGK